MTKSKKLLISLVSVFVAFSTAFIVWFNYEPNKTTYFEGCIESSININNLQEVIGASDYVFVGYVEEIYDYNHDRLFHKFPEIIDYYGGPFTECKVKVTECIKGNIPAGETLSYYKVGGITWLRTSIYLDVEEGNLDYYPQEGKYYIFRGNAHPDGIITGGGTFSTDLLEEGIDATNYKQSEIYQKWLDAYENQIVDNTESYSYLCTTDENYGDGTYNAEIFGKYKEWKDKIDSPMDEEYYKAVKDGNPKIK